MASVLVLPGPLQPRPGNPSRVFMLSEPLPVTIPPQPQQVAQRQDHALQEVQELAALEAGGGALLEDPTIPQEKRDQLSKTYQGVIEQAAERAFFEKYVEEADLYLSESDRLAMGDKDREIQLDVVLATLLQQRQIDASSLGGLFGEAIKQISEEFVLEMALTVFKKEIPQPSRQMLHYHSMIPWMQERFKEMLQEVVAKHQAWHQQKIIEIVGEACRATMRSFASPSLTSSEMKDILCRAIDTIREQYTSRVLDHCHLKERAQAWIERHRGDLDEKTKPQSFPRIPIEQVMRQKQTEARSAIYREAWKIFLGKTFYSVLTPVIREEVENEMNRQRQRIAQQAISRPLHDRAIQKAEKARESARHSREHRAVAWRKALDTIPLRLRSTSYFRIAQERAIAEATAAYQEEMQRRVVQASDWMQHVSPSGSGPFPPPSQEAIDAIKAAQAVAKAQMQKQSSASV